MRGDTRAVSDSLGFIFIFALVIAIVGLTFAVGFNGLQDSRDFERLNNAERAFDVMADNFDDIVRRGAPSRATEIKVADAQLRMGNETTVNVSIDNGTNTESFLYDVEPIIYEAGDGRIVYANGAVFREDAGGAVVVRHSEFILSSERVLIPVVTTRSGGEATSVAGTTTVLVRATSPEGQRQSFGFEAVRDGNVANVTVEITTPRPAAWERELNRHDDVDCGAVTDTSVTCYVQNPDHVSVQETAIDIAFE